MRCFKTYFTFSIIALALLTVSCSENKQDEQVEMHFTNSSYQELRQALRAGPQNVSEVFKSRMINLPPSVSSIINTYEKEGLEAALLQVHSILSSSEDEVELIEIKDSMLHDYTGNSPLLLWDPEIVFELFDTQEHDEWNEDQKAAAEYLVACAYSRGYFNGALLSEEEEIIATRYDSRGDFEGTEEERLSNLVESRAAAVRQEGRSRLMEVYDLYPNSRSSILARFDYMRDSNAELGKTDISFTNDTLDIVKEKYPETAFMTLALTQAGVANLQQGNQERAIDLLVESLNYPNLRGSDPNKGLHEETEFHIKRIEAGLGW